MKRSVSGETSAGASGGTGGTGAARALLFLLTLGCSPDDQAVLAQQEAIFRRVLEPDPSAQMRMWAFQQGGDDRWIPRSRAAAHSFTSLGLHTEGDDRLVVVGQHILADPSMEEKAQGVAWTQELIFDGTGWTARIRQLDDASVQGHSDDQWLGDELWFFHAEGAPSKAEVAQGRTDPVLQPGAHRIRSTPPTQTRLSLEGVSDPSPVRFRDELHLFVTQVGRGGGIHHFAGPDLAARGAFYGVTVPFATVVGDELWLLAQQLVNGRFMPVLARSADGRQWTDWTPMLDVGRDQMSSCTSPVMGELKGQRWLFCVEMRRDFGQHTPGGAPKAPIQGRPAPR